MEDKTMTEFLNSLRTETEQARQRASEEAKEAESQRKKSELAARRQTAKRIREFVKEKTEPTIIELQTIATTEAERGKTEAEKYWRVARNEGRDRRIVEPTEELTKYRALSLIVASHFSELGLIADIIDDRYSVTERHPEGGTITTETDYRVGVKLSWGETQTSVQ